VQVERGGHGDEFDVPGEAGVVEVLAHHLPDLGVDGLGPALVVVQRLVEQLARGQGEAVAEESPGERLVALDGRVRVATGPDCQVGLAVANAVNDDGRTAGVDPSASVKERTSVSGPPKPAVMAAPFPRRYGTALTVTGRSAGSPGTASFRIVEFDADRVRVQCLVEVAYVPAGGVRRRA